jgi:RNA polymerase sigma factor (sigma-70 family)
MRSKGKDAALTTRRCAEDIEMGAERRDAIRQAVWNLRTAERELIVLRYYNGFSQAQISSVLEITPQAVNGRLVRAKRKIVKYLKRNGFTGVNYGKQCKQ